MTPKARDDSCALIAAYREGLGLAAVVVTGGAGNLRIKVAAADEDSNAEHGRWWCRRAAEAEAVAAAAERLFRRESKKISAGVAAAAGATGQPDESMPISLAKAAILSAANRLNIAVQSDQEIADEAARVVARLEAEMQQQRHSGGLKAVNKAYRDYRLAASARGERVLRYDEWMSKYRQNLVRQLALALRQI
jgi:hypothetical protein